MKRGKTTPKLSSNVKADTWVKVYETILTEAATSLTISNLLGDTDKEYKLEARIVNGYNGAALYQARPNNDTGNNYGFQDLSGINTTAAAVRDTSEAQLRLGGCAALNNICQTSMVLSAKSGFVRTAIIENMNSIATTTVTDIYLQGQSWNNTADQITSLVVLANQTGGLGIGSNIVLWKKVAS